MHKEEGEVPIPYALRVKAREAQTEKVTGLFETMEMRSSSIAANWKVLRRTD